MPSPHAPPVTAIMAAPVSVTMRDLLDIAPAFVIEGAGILLVELIENAVPDIGNPGHGLERPNRSSKRRGPRNAEQCCQERSPIHQNLHQRIRLTQAR
jgi:hypothetical protein